MGPFQATVANSVIILLSSLTSDNVIGFSKKSVEMVSLLLTHPGLDVNLKDGDETPLFRAIIKNSTEMVKLLVEDKRLDKSIESFGKLIINS